MNKTNKAQVSIEVILIIVFLIIFLIVFNNLSLDTSKTLEKNKILEQENQIADSLNSFIKVQESIVIPGNNLDFNISFNIPEINVASKNIFCEVFITSTNISVLTYNYDEIVRLDKNVNFDFTRTDFSKTIRKSCGSSLLCTLKDDMLSCS